MALVTFLAQMVPVYQDGERVATEVLTLVRAYFGLFVVNLREMTQRVTNTCFGQPWRLCDPLPAHCTVGLEKTGGSNQRRGKQEEGIYLFGTYRPER